MAESNDNDSHFSLKESNSANGTDNLRDDNTTIPNAAGYCQDEALIADENPSNTLESKREGNPFSFKRFLNQDAVHHRLQNFRRTNYSPDNITSCNSSGSTNQNFNYIGVDNGSKVLNTNDMASVLPDFVQDHLVIEQCYLNSSPSAINIDNLNLHDLPDLNLEHRHVNNDGQRSDINHHSSSSGISNLPDCTSDVRDYSGRSDLDGFSVNKALPDFTVNTSGVSRTMDRENDEFFPVDARDNSTRKNVQRNSENNQSNRCNPRMSSSPSVPLDLPSYDGAEAVSVSSISLEQPIPFDLTVAAEDRNGSYRGMPSTETVSKSLPDFLSDGPIQNDRLGENLQLGNLVSSIIDNDQRISHTENDRFDRSRMERELILLRRELAEKNRRIHVLESEIEHVHSHERRESNSVDHALHLQTERNLRQTLERASKAETALMKSRLENNRLRVKLSSLRVENSVVKPDDETDPSRGRQTSQKIAKELRIAADAAENSLRSLLTGIDNLRMIAATIESIYNYNEKTDEMDEFNNEDSASGPALDH